MKKNLKPMIISALTAVAMGGVGVGTTFALFTDKAETSISVQAGVVEIANDMKITGAKSLYDTPETVVDEISVTYVNGGTAAVNNETHKVEIKKWTPGDEITLSTIPDNKSNVNTLMRLRIVAEGDLAPALVIKGKKSTETDYQFVIKGNKNIATGWEEIDYTKDPAAYVLNISFPNTDNEIRDKDDLIGDNKYQDKTAAITIYYEVVQGNAHVDDLLDRVNFKLAQEEINDNGANKTMNDAFADLTGLLTPTLATQNSLVWSEEIDQFIYESSITSDKYKYFKVYNELPAVADQDFSIYANEWSNVTTVALDGVGFDAGISTGIETISYVNSSLTPRTVSIRTNSGTLTVDAATDVVHHYGNLGYLNIIAVAGQSYHEYGKVGFVEIAKGRVALEKNSEVEQIHFDYNETADKFEEIIVAYEPTVTLPVFSRDPVQNIKENGTLVVELQNSTDKKQADSDYIWLYQQGLKEQIRVSDSKESAGDVTARDSSVDENTSTAAGQLANIINGDLDYDDVKNEDGSVSVQVNESGLSQEDKEASIDAVVETSVIEEIETCGLYEARIGSTAYATLKQAINSAVSGDVVKVLKDVNITEFGNSADCSCMNESSKKEFFVNLINAGVTIDGNYHTINIGSENGAYFASVSFGVIKNVTFTNVRTSLVDDLVSDASFINVKTYGEMRVTGNQGVYGLYLYRGTAAANISFINCDCSVNIYGTGSATDYNAVFAGYTGSQSLNVTYRDCIYRGTMVCGRASYFLGNPNFQPRIIIENCKNLGTIKRTFESVPNDPVLPNSDQVIFGVTSSYSLSTAAASTIDGETFTMDDVRNGDLDASLGGTRIVGNNTSLDLKYEDNKYKVIGLEGAGYYVLNFGLYVDTLKNGEKTGTARYYIKETLTSEGFANLRTLQFVDNTWVAAHEGAVLSHPSWNEEVTIVTYENVDYYLVAPENYTLDGNVHSYEMMSVSAFDSQGRLMASAGLSE